MTGTNPLNAPGDIFDRIRDGFRFVNARARHVRIREDRLTEYALSLQPRPPENTLDDTHHYISENPEHLAAYVLALEALNFGSGYEEDLIAEGWPRIDNSLYFTVATALKASFATYGPWSVDVMKRFTSEDAHAVFALPRARMSQAMAALAASSLNELGQFIGDEFDGRFMSLIDACDGQAARCVSLLGTMPGFQDVPNYHGRDIPIYKRAQHGTASLYGMFGRIGRPIFADIDRLTIFADSGLPQVLRVDGILELDPALEGRIDAGEILTAGSDEEIELRCCTAEAVERLAAIKGMRVTDLDYVLWHRSVEDERYKNARPHRVLTRFY